MLKITATVASAARSVSEHREAPRIPRGATNAERIEGRHRFAGVP
jgi:hypothetical protein